MIITFGTPKGGAGKTTALLSIANAARLKNPQMRIALVDTDRDVASLSCFWDRRKAILEKDETLRLWSLDRQDPDGSMRGLEQAFAWADLTLIDVQGQASAFNDRMAAISDVTIIPTRLGLSDFEPAAHHLARHERRCAALGRSFRGGLLLTFVPLTAPSRQERFILDTIYRIGLPVFATRIHQRTVYKDAQDVGALLAEMRPTASLGHATDEGMRLLDEILNLADTGRLAPGGAAPIHDTPTP